MITFDKIVAPVGEYYYCKKKDPIIGDTMIGYLDRAHGGEYTFYPTHLAGVGCTSALLKEIAFKLEALNEPVVKKLLAEAIEDDQGFTD